MQEEKNDAGNIDFCQSILVKATVEKNAVRKKIWPNKDLK